MCMWINERKKKSKDAYVCQCEEEIARMCVYVCLRETETARMCIWVSARYVYGCLRGRETAKGPRLIQSGLVVHFPW